MLGKIRGRRRRGRERMGSLDGITDSMDMGLGELLDTVKDRGAWCTAVHQVTKTLPQNNSNSKVIIKKDWSLHLSGVSRSRRHVSLSGWFGYYLALR